MHSSMRWIKHISANHRREQTSTMTIVLTMTSPNNAIPSKAAMASDELSCSRPCGLSCTEANEQLRLLVCNAYDLTSSLAVVARGTYLTWDRLPTNFRGTNLSGGTWENVRLLKKGWQYHECKGELDHSIHGPIRGDFWPQSPLRRSCTRNGSGGRCTYAKETRPDSAECKSKHRFYSDNWGHSPTISKILIYIHKRRALGKSVITATFTLMTLLEWILAAAINKAAESHAKNRKIGLCKQQ